MSDGKKHLVIVESPGKVKTIARVLGHDYIVKASIGHVRDLPKDKFKDKPGALVLGVAQDFTPSYVTLATKKKVLEDLRRAAAGADRIYLCPDPDREGEAIAWHLQQALDLPPERTFRVTFDEITERAIRAAMRAPRQIDMDLVNAQQARRVLDRLVGYKLSPLLWKKIGSGLSAGRVQSVAVKLIVLREREIEAFRADEYWTLGALFAFANRTFEADLRALDGQQVVSSADDVARFRAQAGRLSASGVARTLLGTQAEAEAVRQALLKAAYEVTQFEVKEVADRPYPPFATSQLQQAAANRMGFDARRTMRVAQDLYQGVSLGAQGPVALITYMRTDSFRISQEALGECRTLIEKKYGPDYVPEKPNFYTSPKGGQGAHECIRPTHVELTPDEVRAHLSDEQAKLYRLIWERFVACQMPPARFDAQTCDLAAQGEGTRNAVFRATGRVLKFPGWLVVQGGPQAETAAHLDAAPADRELGDETTDVPEEKARVPKARKATQVLPAMRTGDRPDLKSLEALQHFTQPPPRYTEASLVKMLEREGIGRPSTYAAILSTIQDRGYAFKESGGGRGPFHPTPLGIAVTDRLSESFDHSIMDLGFTRKMETELDRIEEQHTDWKKVLREFYDPFSADLLKAAQSMSSTKEQAEPSDVKCPLCGGPMAKRLNRYGEYLRCTRKDECKGMLRIDNQGQVHERNSGQPTGLKCDLCGKDVLKSTGRFGAYLHCVDYPAKKCPFTMKLNKQGQPLRKFKPFATGLKCAKCQSPLVVRVARRGKNPRPFLSCSNFPRCRAAQNFPEGAALTPELKALGAQAMRQFHEITGRDKADSLTLQTHTDAAAPPGPSAPGEASGQPPVRAGDDPPAGPA